ncbi:MAG: glycine--tRNA ligase [Opitutales bacterium]|nr:glycine--tRNA ligase [Opitutales bacterium]
MAKNKAAPNRMESIVALCKRRGFIFQAADIYSGINGFFDYGPLGVEMRRNIKDAWWRDMVHRRDDMVGLDSSIITHPQVWQSSGHLDGFSDPMVDCKKSKNRYRADQLFFAKITVSGETLGYVSVMESETMEEDARKAADKLARKAGHAKADDFTLRDYTEADPSEYELIPSPATGEPGSLTPPRDFNLMFQTYIGALRDENAVAYLRPETAQGIFINFRNVTDSGRVKVPFGIAQIGKAFRNEINPRNFIFRSREFEQMEIEYFISPDEDVWPKIHRDWIETRLNWFESIGLPREKLGEDEHPKEKLAHYAKACTDITFEFPFGVQELEGIAARGNFDLTQHQEGSGRPMDYFDEARKERYVPHVIEPSVGVDRIFLALITAAYEEEELEGDKRTVLKLHPRIAPIKVAVLPLVKNKEPLVEKAQSLYRRLQRRWNVFYDASGAIGRRYRRMDEIGTPFCVTVDFDSLEDGTVTLRDRDSMEQKRISEEDLLVYLEEQIDP